MSSTSYQQAQPVRYTPVAALDTETRGAFIIRTYAHVVGAILAFAGIEMYLFSAGYAETIALKMLSVNWLLILGAFMLVGWLATRTAHTVESKAMQYLALGAFVVAEAIIFLPMLWMAFMYAPGAIESAASATLLGVIGLTAVAIITRKDFSFLRSVLVWGGIVALIAIVLAVVFGWQMGTWFSVGMIAFAGAAVLYDTSNVLHHYPQDKHVAAALELFASIALMFWYVLRLFMARD